MDRRDLLKTLTLSTVGYSVATPTLIQLLVSCNSKQSVKWEPLFLDKIQAFAVEQLTDLILPSSDTPGALEVGTPQFLDLILKNICSKKDQDIFIKGAALFQNKFETTFKKDVLNGSKEDFDHLLSIYFKISDKKQQEIFQYIDEEDAKQGEKNDHYFIYKYLIFIREYSLFAFYTSKRIGTEVLDYTPVPGAFEACVSTNEAGKISAL